MKNFLFSLMKQFLSIFLISYAYAIPTYTGTKGLHKIKSAESYPRGKFHYVFGVRGFWGSSDDSIPKQFIPKYDIIGNPLRKDLNFVKGRSGIFDASLGLSFSFTDYLSLNIRNTFCVDYMETKIEARGSAAMSSGFSDMEVGIKFTPTKLKESSSIDLGIYPLFYLPIGSRRDTLPTKCGADTFFGDPMRINKGGLHRFYTNKKFVIGCNLLVSYKKEQICGHFNFGVLSKKYSGIIFGIGVENLSIWGRPFLEIYGEKRLKKEYDDGGIYITPGIRLGEKVSATIIVSFRILGSKEYVIYDEHYIQKGFGTTPPWYININFSQCFDVWEPSPY